MIEKYQTIRNRLKKYTPAEYKKALEIASICLQASGACRYENPMASCLKERITKIDCYSCLEEWLLEKARKELR